MIKCSAYITSENENELRDSHTAIECRQAHAALPLSLSSVSFPFVLRTKRNRSVQEWHGWMHERQTKRHDSMHTQNPARNSSASLPPFLFTCTGCGHDCRVMDCAEPSQKILGPEARGNIWHERVHGTVLGPMRQPSPLAATEAALRTRFSEFCHSHAASSAGTRINSSHHRLLKEIVPALHHFEGCLPRTHLGDAPARDCTV